MKLSPIFNDTQLKDNGTLAVGYKIYTYLAGSSTLAATYENSSGSANHTNPIVLNARGEPDNLIWLDDGVTYKFVYTTDADVTIKTFDNISGINDALTSTAEQWINSNKTPTYINTTKFSLDGDQTSDFQVYRRVKITVSSGTVYGYISKSEFTTLTTITVALDSGTLDAGISNISYGLLTPQNPSSPQNLQPTIGKNLLINAQGLINQRAYVSGTATTVANQYTLDRWRVVTSGQNLTFSTTNNEVTFTAPAGGVEQVIEGLNLVSGTYTLSWTGTATATVNGSAITNGGQVVIVGGSNTTIRFIGGTFKTPQFEKGNVATVFDYRLYANELLLCQRYYQIILWLVSGYTNASSLDLYSSTQFSVPMRTSPSVIKTSGSFTNCTDPGAPSANSYSLNAFARSSAAGVIFGSWTGLLSAEL